MGRNYTNALSISVTLQNKLVSRVKGSFFLLLSFFLLYSTLLVLPYTDMNPPQVYMSYALC